MGIPRLENRIKSYDPFSAPMGMRAAKLYREKYNAHKIKVDHHNNKIRERLIRETEEEKKHRHSSEEFLFLLTAVETMPQNNIVQQLEKMIKFIKDGSTYIEG